MYTALLALALTVVAQVELWLLWGLDPDEPELALAFGTRLADSIAAAAFTASIAVHRRLPVLPLGLAIPAVVLAPVGPFDGLVGTSLALIVAAYLAAASARSRGELGVGAVTAVAVGIASWLSHPASVTEVGDVLVLSIGIGGPWLAGATVWLRREREAQLERHARRLDDDRAADLAGAAAAERARIARELHDVVAHAISVIVLQARGARRSMANDPTEATVALDAIETTASRALAEMRRLVDVLRPQGEPGSLAPQPGLANLASLIGEVREAGLPVDLQVEGDAVELPPGIDLAAYRVVQEALTNALRHARAAAARVVVRYRLREVEVEVVDDGTASGEWTAGHGTIGMRERTALYGGTLEVGPRAGGGFGVLARLPLEPD